MNEKNKLDAFIKGKLQNLQQQPAAATWDKLQAKMTREKKAFPWWPVSVAASIFLLSTLGWWRWSGTDEELLMVDKQQPAVQQNLHHQNQKPSEQIADEPSTSQGSATADKSMKVEAQGNQLFALKADVPLEEELKAEVVVSPGEVAVDPLLAEVEIKSLEIKTQEAPRPKTLKVIYKPGKPEETKDNTEPDFEELNKEKRGLLRFVALAREIKEGELSYGELRDAKDDLLAINLRGIRSRINDQIFDRTEENEP
ncbi:MAG: hypothetical protein JJU28_02785 [Cyclobacteriaceae bacterium]|nr:hypothetical protein [Cyclobacteriaceae bacterium]